MQLEHLIWLEQKNSVPRAVHEFELPQLTATQFVEDFGEKIVRYMVVDRCRRSLLPIRLKSFFQFAFVLDKGRYHAL